LHARRADIDQLTLCNRTAYLSRAKAQRVRREPSVIHVPVYTDFKLHDITDPTDATAREPVDMNQPVGSPAFFAGNRRFLTRRLWGIASQPAHFHHGLFTTLREAVPALRAAEVDLMGIPPSEAERSWRRERDSSDGRAKKPR
jgi:cytochrome c peroxidase